MSNEEKNFLGEFRLASQYTSVFQITAVGAAVFTGLAFLLTGLLTTIGGSWAPLAGFLSLAVMGLTLLSLVELLAGSSRRGGTYTLIQETIGGAGAFVAGWGILTGTILMGTVFVEGAASHLLLTLKMDIPPVYLTLGIFLIFAVVQIIQIFPRFLHSRTIFFVLLAIILLILVSDFPLAKLSNYRASPNPDFTEITGVIGVLMVAYAVFETQIASRRLIRRPGRMLPRAILGTLVFGGLFLGLTSFLSLTLSGSTPPGSKGFTQILTNSSPLPGWSIELSIFLLLILGANHLLMSAIRQIHSMSREGTFPIGLRLLKRPFQMPPGLFAVLSVFIIPAFIWMPFKTAIDLAAGMFILGLIGLNAAAIYSHWKEPDRRRTFVVPFSPLIPGLAITLNTFLLFELPASVLLGGGAWVIVGLGYYMIYARRGQVEAQEGEVVFGRGSQLGEKDRYRILVPLGEEDERQLVLSIAVALAKQLNGEVIPLQVIRVPDPLAVEEGRREAKERNRRFRLSTQLAENAGVPSFPITRLARSVPEGIIDTAVEEDCDLVLLSWVIRERKQRGQLGSILDPVARNIPIDIATVAFHPDKVPDMDDSSVFKPESILVPTAGGPHAPLAIQLSLLLSREFNAGVKSVYVTSQNATEEDKRQGEQRIHESITAMREQESKLADFAADDKPLDEIPIDGRVITASGVVEGIAKAGEETDLIFIGATEESLLDQFLFGSIPEQVAQKSATPVIMVKRYRGLPRFWLHRIWNAFYELFPQVTQEEQIEVYRRLHRGARPRVDFFIMIGLSSLIATFGLLLNSSAVIIGAMLVAPLFTPLMALSLAIVQGNIRLLRLAIESTIKGVALAIGLAVVMTAITPLTTVTPEIAGRTQPNLLDLGVALASGVAGAYAVSRKEVAAALPGVAIAAALVPPLGVIGIGLGMGDIRIAAGAGLLIATNLIAIALSGSITMLLLGFRPSRRGEGERLRRGLISALILFVLVTIPLAVVFFQSIRVSQRENLVQQTLQAALAENPQVQITNLDEIEITSLEEGLTVTVSVYASESPSEAFVDQITSELEEAIGEPVHLRVVVLSVLESQ